MSIQFSDLTTKNGLIQNCEILLFGDSGYTQISSNPNRLLTFTNLINRALDEVSGLIMQSDGRWQYDDTNFTDLPIGKTLLADGQQQYQLSTSQLKIIRVEIKGLDGKYYRIDPLDQSDIQNMSLTEYLNSASRPLHYDLMGDSIYLYPKPQTGYVTMLEGMKIYYQREPSYFVSTDTTKKPGVASIYHEIVTKIACLNYAIARQLPQKKDLQEQVAMLKAGISDFYTRRQLDERPAFRTAKINWN